MLGILAIVGLLLLCYGLVFFSYKIFTNQKKAKRKIEDESYDILKVVKSNNTYPPILDVFKSLSENLSEQGMELNADLRGYLDYGETE